MAASSANSIARSISKAPGRSGFDSSVQGLLPQLRTRVREATLACFRSAARVLTRGRLASQNTLRIEEQLSLGPKKTVFLLHCHGRRFLVAAGSETVTSLVELHAPRAERAAVVSFGKPVMAARLKKGRRAC